MVFRVSTGMRKILKLPAQTDANTDFAQTGKFLVLSRLLSKCKDPEFDAVSPNLLKGPY